jgi:hypothetical protein
MRQSKEDKRRTETKVAQPGEIKTYTPSRPTRPRPEKPAPTITPQQPKK